MLERERGDVFTIETPGGGSFGSPFERDLAAVLIDVKSDVVSEEGTLVHYGVVVSDGILDVHAAAATRAGAQMSAGKFDFGEERVAWERILPDATDIALNRSQPGRPLFETAACPAVPGTGSRARHRAGCFPERSGGATFLLQPVGLPRHFST